MSREITLTQRLNATKYALLIDDDRRAMLRGMKRIIKTNDRTKTNLLLDRQTIKELTVDQIATVVGGNASTHSSWK